MRLWKKILAVVIIIIVVIAASFYLASAKQDDTATGTLTVMIKEVGTDNSWIATANFDQPTFTQTIFGRKSVPFTTYNPVIPPLEENTEYTISFAVTTLLGNPEDIAIITNEKVIVTSETIVHTNLDYFLSSAGDRYMSEIKTNLDPATLVTFTVGSFIDAQITATGLPGPLLGKYINSSTFTLRIMVDGTDTAGYPAKHTEVTADILITVTDPTTMNLIIDDVTASAG